MTPTKQDAIVRNATLAQSCLAGALALAQFNPADRDNLELLLDSADEYSTKAREALGQNGANEEKGHA
jgi:hypothetical protein